MKGSIENKYLEVKENKDLLEKEREDFFDANEYEKNKEFSEYINTLKEYKTTIKEFNKEARENEWTQSDLKSLDLTPEEKSMITFVEKNGFISINDSIVDDDKIAFFVYEKGKNISVLSPNTDSDNNYISSKITTNVNAYESLLKGDSDFDYFDKVMFVSGPSDGATFNPSTPEYAFWIPDDNNFNKDMIEKMFPGITFDAVLDGLVSHELGHNIDYQLGNLVNVDPLNQNNSTHPFSESKEMENLIQPYLNQTNSLTSFIKELNFFSDELFIDQNLYNKDIPFGHPWDSCSEFFTSFMNSVVALSQGKGLSFEKRWELYAKNNNLQLGEDSPQYQEIHNGYFSLLSGFSKNLNQLLSSDTLTPKHYQLIHSLIGILDGVYATNK